MCIRTTWDIEVPLGEPLSPPRSPDDSGNDYSLTTTEPSGKQGLSLKNPRLLPRG